MEAVAEMTNYTFSEIYDMPVMEFFAYCQYIVYKSRKREQEIKQFRRKHK